MNNYTLLSFMKTNTPIMKETKVKYQQQIKKKPKPKIFQIDFNAYDESNIRQKQKNPFQKPKY